MTGDGTSLFDINFGIFMNNSMFQSFMICEAAKQHMGSFKHWYCITMYSKNNSLKI
jgi:hypothetical protein